MLRDYRILTANKACHALRQTLAEHAARSGHFDLPDCAALTRWLRSARRLRFDPYRGEPRGKVGYVVIAQGTGQDDHHFVFTRAAAIGPQLGVEVDRRLTREVGGVRSHRHTEWSVTNGARLGLGAASVNVACLHGAWKHHARDGDSKGKSQETEFSSHAQGPHFPTQSASWWLDL